MGELELEKVDMENIKIKILRAFGFAYPHTTIIVHDDKDEQIIENPEILVKEHVKKKYTLINSIITSDEGDVYVVRGDIRKYLKPQRIIDIYPEGAMALLLPAFTIYTFILLWMFGAVAMDTIAVMIITFLMAMMLFQGKKIYEEGGILAVDVAKKGDIGGIGLYVPMAKDFLEFEPSDDKHIINDTIKRLASLIKPLIAENKLLTEEVNKMADGLSKSFLLGLRMRKGYMDLSEKYPVWMWLLVGMVIGIIVGLVLGGGVAPAPGTETGGVPP